MVVIGGVGSLPGAILGAAVVVGLPELSARYRRLSDAGLRRDPDRHHAVRRRGSCRVLRSIGAAFGGGNAARPQAARIRKQRNERLAAPAVLVEARGVTRLFGGLEAVDAVDFTVRRGSVHGLIGPNGAGKTTLLNLVAGVFPSTCGVLRFAARTSRGIPARDAPISGIRRTFQNVKLFGEMTALENVAIGLHAQPVAAFSMLSSHAARTPRGAQHSRALHGGAALRGT